MEKRWTKTRRLKALRNFIRMIIMQLCGTIRQCMREPIPEIMDAARLLDEAVTAHLIGRSDLAAQLIQTSIRFAKSRAPLVSLSSCKYNRLFAHTMYHHTPVLFMVSSVKVIEEAANKSDSGGHNQKH